jgi:hypothetical protein
LDVGDEVFEIGHATDPVLLRNVAASIAIDVGDAYELGGVDLRIESGVSGAELSDANHRNTNALSHR